MNLWTIKHERIAGAAVVVLVYEFIKQLGAEQATLYTQKRPH